MQLLLSICCITMAAVAALVGYPGSLPSRSQGVDTVHQELELDELLLMHMEKEWGMREMARYKESKGAWPLRSELKGYHDVETQRKVRRAKTLPPVQMAIEDYDDWETNLLDIILDSLPKLPKWHEDEPSTSTATSTETSAPTGFRLTRR